MTITPFICYVINGNMDNLDIKRLKQIFSALDNEFRLKIIELCSNKGLTITELSKQLKLNYSITVEYTSMLEKANLVQKSRNDDRTVTVKSLIGLNNEGEVRKF
jgi:DNA-binding transcriptional ArsR family regulator